jgi:Voltage gated chloride channel
VWSKTVLREIIIVCIVLVIIYAIMTFSAEIGTELQQDMEVAAAAPPPSPKPKGNSTQSLDFERVINSYSIATTREQLMKHGEAALPESSNSNSAYHSIQPLAVHARHGHGGHGQEQHHGHHHAGKSWTRWMLTLLTGLSCGIVAIFILFCVQKLNSFRGEQLNRQMQWATGHASAQEMEAYYKHASGLRFLNFILALPIFTQTLTMRSVFFEYAIYNLFLALTSSALCLAFAPLAIGSGIPEVKAYLNGVCVPSFADLNVFLVKVFGTILAVSSGLIVGPEGPL